MTGLFAAPIYWWYIARKANIKHQYQISRFFSLFAAPISLAAPINLVQDGQQHKYISALHREKECYSSTWPVRMFLFLWLERAKLKYVFFQDGGQIIKFKKIHHCTDRNQPAPSPPSPISQKPLSSITLKQITAFCSVQ